LHVLSHRSLIDDSDDSFWAWHEAPRIVWSKCGQLSRPRPCLMVRPLSCCRLTIIPFLFSRRLICRSCVLPVAHKTSDFFMQITLYRMSQNEHTKIWKSNNFTAN
jgi:hypothetical protein